MLRIASGNILCLILAFFVTSEASAQNIDSTYYYKLSTKFRGPGMKLDVFNGGPKNNMTHLTADQNVSGQYWLFTGNSDRSFRLSNLFRGRRICLDIFNGGPNQNQPHLTDCANLTGQMWTVTEEGDAVRLTTKFRGPGMCLDIFNGGPNDNQPHLMPCGNFSGQLWQLTKTDKRSEGAVTID